MSNNKFNMSTITERHKRLKRNIIIKTIFKNNKTKIKSNDVKKIAEKMQSLNPNKKVMIKALSGGGYFQLKGYDEGFDVILDEERYMNGREDAEKASIYKFSIYLI